MTSHSHWLMKLSLWDSFTCVGTKLKQHSKKRFLGRGFHCVWNPTGLLLLDLLMTRQQQMVFSRQMQESYASSANRTEANFKPEVLWKYKCNPEPEIISLLDIQHISILAVLGLSHSFYSVLPLHLWLEKRLCLLQPPIRIWMMELFSYSHDDKPALGCHATHCWHSLDKHLPSANQLHPENTRG